MDMNILGDEIGRGGYGRIYEITNNKNLCAKVSDKKMEGCRKWSNEFNKIKSIMLKIKDDTFYKRLKMVKIITPLEFKETDGLCMMIMPKIYRPDDIRYSKSIQSRKYNSAPSILQTNGKTKYTIQAQLGITSGRMIFKGRGEFIGLKEIKEFVSNEDLKVASYELGMIMGLIHFVGNNDAYDIEVYLGKDYMSKKVRFYIADFDMSEEIKEFDDSTIERMTWSIDAVPYFPTKSSDPVLFELFKKGYSIIAKNPVIVEKVFEKYG